MNHIKEMNLISRTVGNYCGVLIRVGLHLENLHLGLHFGKIPPAALLTWVHFFFHVVGL